MRIILRESADAQQAVQDARAFIPIYRTQLAVADGEVPITPQVRLVNHDVVGAVHRLELVLAAFQLHRGKHILPIVVHVAARLPQIEPRNVGRVDQIVAVFDVLFAPEILDQESHQSALRMPEDQARTDFILDGNQVEFFPDLAMIAAFDLFKTR